MTKDFFLKFTDSICMLLHKRIGSMRRSAIANDEELKESMRTFMEGYETALTDMLTVVNRYAELMAPEEPVPQKDTKIEFDSKETKDVKIQ